MTFGGRIGLTGFSPGDLNVTATGQQMRIRYPEGFRSVVDADLSLTGHHGRAAASRNGDRPRRALFEALRTKRGLLEPGRSGGAPLASAAPSTPTLPLPFDVQIDAPSALRVENNIAQHGGERGSQTAGTYDRPVLFGTRANRARRHHLRGQPIRGDPRQRSGSPTRSRIEPYFDIEAETRVRVPGRQIYRITLGFTGTTYAHVAEPQFRSAAVERSGLPCCCSTLDRGHRMPSCGG